MVEAQTPDARSRRPGGRSARVRAAVLAATMKEFTESGYGGLSAGRIAERAGVNRSTIHRRWGSLDNLLADALVETAATAIPMPDTGSAQDDLDLLLRSITSYIDTDATRAWIRALVGDAARSPAVGAIVSSAWTTRFHVGEDVISRAAARGEIRDDIPPATILATLLGPLYVRLLLTDQRIDDQFIDDIIDIVLNSARHRTKKNKP
jgi:AcrR family transcriptional regulator